MSIRGLVPLTSLLERCLPLRDLVFEVPHPVPGKGEAFRQTMPLLRLRRAFLHEVVSLLEELLGSPLPGGAGIAGSLPVGPSAARRTRFRKIRQRRVLR